MLSAVSKVTIFNTQTYINSRPYIILSLVIRRYKIGQLTIIIVVKGSRGFRSFKGSKS